LRQINKKQTWHLGGKGSEKIDNVREIMNTTDSRWQREKAREEYHDYSDRNYRDQDSRPNDTPQNLDDTASVVFVRLYVLTVRLQGTRSLLDECRTNPVWLLKPCFTIQALQGWSLAISMRWHGLYLYTYIYLYISCYIYYYSYILLINLVIVINTPTCIYVIYI